MKKIHKIIIISVAVLFVFVAVFTHCWLLVPRSFSKLIDGREIVSVELILFNIFTITNNNSLGDIYKYSILPENEKFLGFTNSLNEFEYLPEYGNYEHWGDYCKIRFADGNSIVIYMEHIVEYNNNNERIRMIKTKNSEVKLYSIKTFMIKYGVVTQLSLDEYNYKSI